MVKDDKVDRLSGIGDKFQQETKYAPGNIEGYSLDHDIISPPFKEYSSCIKRVTLPTPVASGDADIWRTLQQRRSSRLYKVEQHIAIQDLSCLLWATQGATAKWGDFIFRTAPSAGGLYPIETYISVRSVESLMPGIYHFRPKDFDLEFIKEGDYSIMLARAALDQAIAANAQMTFVWSALAGRSKWKYRQRAYRYIYLDAGHICQNLYLAAEALGLGVCAIGAFYDDLVNRIVELDGTEETAVYMATVGVPDDSEFNS